MRRRIGLFKHLICLGYSHGAAWHRVDRTLARKRRNRHAHG
jgi:hypothetical protein